MLSSFNTSRIFSDQTGWYVIMRESDSRNLISPKYQIIGDKHLMGPFSSRSHVEEWLDAYLSVHAENRIPVEYIPGSIDTHH